MRAAMHRWLDFVSARHGVPVALLACTVSLAAPAVSPPRFALQDLGQVLPVGINDMGQIAGNDESQGAMLYDHGHWTRLGAFRATALNNRGQIAGYQISPGRAVVYSVGTLTSLSGGTAIFDLPAQLVSITPLALNDAGVVVGAIAKGPNDRRPWYAARGTISAVSGEAGAEDCPARDVNAEGVIVGYAVRGGIYESWTAAHGIATEFGAAQQLQAMAINDDGVIAGFAHDQLKSFLYRQGKLTYLPDLSDEPWVAVALNKERQVIGHTALSSHPRVAVLEQAGMTYDVNTLLDRVDARHWALRDAVGINRRGQIVGTGLLDGAAHGFLLTPVGATALAEGRVEESPRR
jgi:hypothetical protein